MATSVQKKDPFSWRETFISAFPKVIDVLMSTDGISNIEMKDSLDHLKACIEYTVPGGKLNRGLMVIGCLSHLSADTSEQENAIILGWCVELLQACFLVADDIMDGSITRRGKPCWYKCASVGMIAVNDALFLESLIYEIIRKHIHQKNYYMNVVELFQKVSYLTKVGQCLDTITGCEDPKDLDSFTDEKYAAIVKYKTAFYSFYLPVGIAMYMTGIDDTTLHDRAKEILLDMGHFFQVQDDYLDCYGDPAVTGKIGTDIQDNKCSWLIVKAFSLATKEQKAQLQANYGRNEEAYVERVKQIYEDLELKKLYSKYEEESYSLLMKKIEGLQGLPADMFYEFAERIYKRKK